MRMTCAHHKIQSMAQARGFALRRTLKSLPILGSFALALSCASGAIVTGVGGKYEHRFLADPDMRPVRLGCDIPPWMRGWIYVFEHPHFSVTDEQGRFRFGAVPPGRYKLILHQPDIRYTSEREVAVAAGQTAKFEIEVRPSAPAKPDE